MNTKLRTRTMGLAALALTASMGLAACGGDDARTSASDDTTSSATPSESETPTESETPSEEPMADGPFGPGCAGVPTSGEGSVEGMADDPVATAASNNPLLKTLVAAVDRGRPRRHPQLGREPHGLRAHRRRVRRDPEEGPQRPPEGQEGPDGRPDPPRDR